MSTSSVFVWLKFSFATRILLPESTNFLLVSMIWWSQCSSHEFINFWCPWEIYMVLLIVLWFWPLLLSICHQLVLYVSLQGWTLRECLGPVWNWSILVSCFGNHNRNPKTTTSQDFQSGYVFSMHLDAGAEQCRFDPPHEFDTCFDIRYWVHLKKFR